MKLLLSGGNAENDDTLDVFFASQIDPDRTVLYVPVADEDGNYEERLAWFTRTYGKYGIRNIEMCVDLNRAVLSDAYAAIYVGGGNTFKLLKEMKESGFDKRLIEYAIRGGFVYGLSAGSIVFGTDITGTTYEDENAVGLADSSGLNLAKGFNICCHYGNGDAENTEYKRNRIRAHATRPYSTIALPNGCAVYIEEDAMTLMGSGAVIL